MSDPDIKTASLEEIRQMKNRGELYRDDNAPAGPSLGTEFWENAKRIEPIRPKSVHLKLDPDVFDFFYRQANGKGHLTKMQAVLKAYAKAHEPS